MPRAKASDGKIRKVAAAAKTAGDASGSSPATRPPAATRRRDAKKLIRMLDQTWDKAIEKNSLGDALNAVVMMGQVMGVWPDMPGSPSPTDKPGRGPPAPAKFNGNYNDAARRIAFLMRLAAKETAEKTAKETAEKAEHPDTANGEEDGRPSRRRSQKARRDNRPLQADAAPGAG